MSRYSAAWNQIWKDRFLIILCFILAFLGWQSIRKIIGLEMSVSSVAVDVEAPDGWAVWEKSVQRVNISFRGSREDIPYLNSDQLQVLIPVQHPERGKEMTIKLTEAHLKNPTGAKVVSFSPSEIMIRLDQKSEKLLPVKASMNGSLPEGLEVERVVCSPASVRVFGARQTLDSMENIHTEAIDLKNRQGSFKESVPIAVPQVGRMSVEPNWVSVEVVLEERDSTAQFDHVPVRILEASGENRSVRVIPETIRVTVQGLKDQVLSLQEKDVFAYINCEELIENTSYELPVVVNLPVNMQHIKAEPAVVQVIISSAQ